jgi:nucleolysin TIA-1/TIAR
MPYEAVAAQTPEFNTTVYVGNLIPYTTQADLIPLFQGYGYIVEIRMQADRGFAFVKLDTHQNAALAIMQLQNQLVHGRPIKCSWGKDKAANDQPGQGQYPQYNSYGYYGGYGYGQTGVPGQPGQTQPEGQQWDAAAQQAYYQGGGWGNYYSESGLRLC